jgi:hypothetical protein
MSNISAAKDFIHQAKLCLSNSASSPHEVIRLLNRAATLLEDEKKFDYITDSNNETYYSLDEFAEHVADGWLAGDGAMFEVRCHKTWVAKVYVAKTDEIDGITRVIYTEVV